MKKDILESYDELIKECKVKIKENKDVEVNKSMLQVYSKIAEEVKGRKDEYYYGLKANLEYMKHISELYQEFLKPISPYNDFIDYESCKSFK